LTGADANELWYIASQSANPEITIRVSEPDEMSDDNPANNEITQPIPLPDILDKNDLTIKYKTNLRPNDYRLTITDDNGIPIKTLSATAANQEYIFRLDDLSDGCYTFQIEDAAGVNGTYLGLSS
jgi:hypothetical protein